MYGIKRLELLGFVKKGIKTIPLFIITCDEKKCFHSTEKCNKYN